VFDTLADGDTIYGNSISEIVFRSQIDLARYPLDDQRLELIFESNTETTEHVQFFVIEGQSSFLMSLICPDGGCHATSSAM